MVSLTASEEYSGALKWVFTKANGNRVRDMATVEIYIMAEAITRVISKTVSKMARECLFGIKATNLQESSKMVHFMKVKKSMPIRRAK